MTSTLGFKASVEQPCPPQGCACLPFSVSAIVPTRICNIFMPLSVALHGCFHISYDGMRKWPTALRVSTLNMKTLVHNVNVLCRRSKALTPLLKPLGTFSSSDKAFNTFPVGIA